MTLFFRSSHGEMREIAKFDDGLTDKEAINVVHKEIRKFCDKRNFKIYYTRIWNEPYDNVMMTKFDVGSHTEFFYIDREIDIIALRSTKED